MRDQVKATSMCVLGTLLIAGVAGCAATSDSVVSEPASPASSGTTSGGQWVGGSGGMNFSEAVADYASYDEPYKASMTALVNTWRQKAVHGTPAKIADEPSEKPSDFTVQDADKALSLLKATPNLSKEDLPSPASIKPKSVNSPTTTASPRAPSEYNPNDPNTYAVLGKPGSGNLYWENMPFLFWTQHCDSEGCETIDKWTTTARIGPGPQNARYTGNSTHFPSGGSVSDIHFDYYAICNGSICGGETQVPSPGPLYMLLDYTQPRWNNVVTSAAILWAWFPAQQRWLDSAAKTTDALCEAKSVGNQCRYS